MPGAAHMRQGRIWDQLEVHYQPIVALDDLRPLAVEALLRWRHPRHGLLPASRAVAELERMGAIGGVGHFVLDQALGALPTLRRAFEAAELRVVVNLWSSELAEGLLADDLARVLARHHELPGTLIVEVSEKALMDDVVAEVLAQVKMAAVGLAVSDFGTADAGFSSLDRVALEQVKIDHRIVSATVGSRVERNIVGALVCLGREVGLTIVAEGVEGADQVQLLRRLGVDAGQGWWLGPPCPLADVAPGWASGGAPHDGTIPMLHPGAGAKLGSRLRDLGVAPAAGPPDGPECFGPPGPPRRSRDGARRLDHEWRQDERINASTTAQRRPRETQEFGRPIAGPIRSRSSSEDARAPRRPPPPEVGR